MIAPAVALASVCAQRQAAALGWMAQEVFGVHPGALERCHDCRGLVLLLCGLPGVAITTEPATIQVRLRIAQLAFRCQGCGSSAPCELPSAD